MNEASSTNAVLSQLDANCILQFPKSQSLAGRNNAFIPFLEFRGNKATNSRLLKLLLAEFQNRATATECFSISDDAPYISNNGAVRQLPRLGFLAWPKSDGTCNLSHRFGSVGCIATKLLSNAEPLTAHYFFGECLHVVTHCKDG